MRQLFFISLVFGFSISFAQQIDFVPQQLIVMLQMGSIESQFENQLDILNDDAKTIHSSQCLSNDLNIWLLQIETGFDLPAVMKKFQAMPEVKLVQLNHFLSPRFTPDDPGFTNQWNLNNTAQSGGTADADIDAPEAWDFGIHATTFNGDTIVIGIDDGGCDLNHEDLSFTKNYFELPGDNTDNDGNGYVDDYDGWNSVSHNGIISADMHGTHVAGIAGAIGNNQTGISGVDPSVKILPVRGGSNTESIVVEGYAYYYHLRKLYNSTNGDSGKFVVSVNSSFGINNGQPSNFPIWSAMYDSMGTVGILNATATANSHVDVDVVGDIPTACPSNYMISVTNTTNADALSPIAAWGDTTIDIAAPGSNIYSSLPNNQYGNLTGTSMSTPHITGAIAFLYSLPCDGFSSFVQSYPDSAALLVKSFLLNGVDTIPDLLNKTVSNGRLNLYKSSLLLMQYFGCPLSVHDLNPNSNDFKIFPVPAASTINAQLFSLNYQNEKWKIVNVLGEEILIQKIVSPITSINLQSFSSGIYLLQLCNEKNEIISTQKFLKQ